MLIVAKWDAGNMIVLNSYSNNRLISDIFMHSTAQFRRGVKDKWSANVEVFDLINECNVGFTRYYVYYTYF